MRRRARPASPQGLGTAEPADPHLAGRQPRPRDPARERADDPHAKVWALMVAARGGLAARAAVDQQCREVRAPRGAAEDQDGRRLGRLRRGHALAGRSRGGRAGRVEVTEAGAGSRRCRRGPGDEDGRGADDAGVRDDGGDGAQRAAEDQLVRPTRAGDDRDGAVVAVVLREQGRELADGLRGEVQGERGAVRGEARQLLAGGMAVARLLWRVRITDWATPGTVSSRPSAAAAAAKAGTPGVIVHGTPASSSRRTCSVTAIQIDRSPGCSRADILPASDAATSSA